jgi:hypothetical protein
VAGYADTAPVETNDTPEGRARNRRVDIVLLNEQGIIGAGEAPGRLHSLTLAVSECAGAGRRSRPMAVPHNTAGWRQGSNRLSG